MFSLIFEQVAEPQPRCSTKTGGLYPADLKAEVQRYLSKRVARCQGTGILWTRSGLTSNRIGAGLCRLLVTKFREDLSLLKKSLLNRSVALTQRKYL
jgi:hypothetical protein